jgi:hypothetical protein
MSPHHQPDHDQPGTASTEEHILLQGGELNGCSVDVIESLYGREEGSRGIFDIGGTVKCSDGAGLPTPRPAHGTATVFHVAGGGTGRFGGLSGRIAQLGGSASKADGGGTNASYDLVVDQNKKAWPRLHGIAARLLDDRARLHGIGLRRGWRRAVRRCSLDETRTSSHKFTRLKFTRYGTLRCFEAGRQRRNQTGAHFRRRLCPARNSQGAEIAPGSVRRR